MTGHLHVSHGVSKLGADIPSVSLPAIVTCRHNCPCADRCYATKGRFRFANVKGVLRNNLELWRSNSALYEVEAKIAAFPFHFFRWHSSGDIPDAAYLRMMVRVAQACPETKFLCFSKQYEIVNGHLDEFGSFPGNLKMVLSAWGSFVPANPYNLPMAYVRLKGESCAIPHDAFECSKYCGDCVMTGHSCWDLEAGQSTVFNEH